MVVEIVSKSYSVFWKPYWIWPKIINQRDLSAFSSLISLWSYCLSLSWHKALEMLQNRKTMLPSSWGLRSFQEATQSIIKLPCSTSQTQDIKKVYCRIQNAKNWKNAFSFFFLIFLTLLAFWKCVFGLKTYLLSLKNMASK